MSTNTRRRTRSAAQGQNCIVVSDRRDCGGENLLFVVNGARATEAVSNGPFQQHQDPTGMGVKKIGLLVDGVELTRKRAATIPLQHLVSERTFSCDARLLRARRGRPRRLRSSLPEALWFRQGTRP